MQVQAGEGPVVGGGDLSRLYADSRELHVGLELMTGAEVGCSAD